jgi:hypothetical protein
MVNKLKQSMFEYKFARGHPKEGAAGLQLIPPETET